MIALDTSVVVAAFATWHEAHERVGEVVAGGAALPAQVAIESFSVLTRLPPPQQARPDIVGEWLSEQFPDPWLSLSAEACRGVLEHLAESGIGGGAVYDAVIAATALEHRATLVTRDRRATRVYDLMGVEVRFLS